MKFINFYLSNALFILALISFSQGRIFLNPPSHQQLIEPRSPATISKPVPVRQFKFHPMLRYKSVSGLGSLCRNIYRYVPKVHNQRWFQNICIQREPPYVKIYWSCTMYNTILSIYVYLYNICLIFMYYTKQEIPLRLARRIPNDLNK